MAKGKEKTKVLSALAFTGKAILQQSQLFFECCGIAHSVRGPCRDRWLSQTSWAHEDF